MLPLVFLSTLEPRIGVTSTFALAALVYALNFNATSNNGFSERLVVFEENNARLAAELVVRMEEVEASLLLAHEASDEKGRFIAAASHDLRQPLHEMTLFLDAIRRRNAQPDLVPMLDRSLEANASLAGLMTGLLDLSSTTIPTCWTPRSRCSRASAVECALRKPRSVWRRCCGSACPTSSCPIITWGRACRG